MHLHGSSMFRLVTVLGSFSALKRVLLRLRDLKSLYSIVLPVGYNMHYRRTYSPVAGDPGRTQFTACPTHGISKINRHQAGVRFYRRDFLILMVESQSDNIPMFPAVALINTFSIPLL